jgi:UDP-N-acetylmuramate--alanine ligase
MLNGGERISRIVANASSDGLRPLLDRLRAPDVLSFSTTGPSSSAALHPIETRLHGSGAAFRLRYHGVELPPFELNVAGVHNVDNAIAATAAALSLDVRPETIAAAMRRFRGLAHRFARVTVGERRIITDFTSHPTAIRRVLESAALTPAPIVVVFRPWRYSLLRYFFVDYGKAFRGAAHVVVAPIDGGGEPPAVGLNEERIAQAIEDAGVATSRVYDLHAIPDELNRVVPERAQVIFFGGTDLFEEATRWASLSRAR